MSIPRVSFCIRSCSAATFIQGRTFMNINQLGDPYLKQELKQFISIMRNWEKGKDIDPDTVNFILMRMNLLLTQLGEKNEED